MADFKILHCFRNAIKFLFTKHNLKTTKVATKALYKYKTKLLKNLYFIL